MTRSLNSYTVRRVQQIVQHDREGAGLSEAVQPHLSLEAVDGAYQQAVKPLDVERGRG